MIPLLGLIVWFFIARWARDDAKGRGVKNTALWFWLIFLLGLIPLIIYLAAIRPKGEMVLCTSCARRKISGIPSCPWCGNRSGAYSTEDYCIHCGARGQGRTGMCSKCGASLS